MEFQILETLSFSEILFEGHRRAGIELQEGDPEAAGLWLIQAGRMLVEKDKILQEECKTINNHKLKTK